jgi:hypothetical protein
MDEEDYIEYHACAFRVKRIINQTLEYKKIKVNSLVEISPLDPPKKVRLYDGTLIWENL